MVSPISNSESMTFFCEYYLFSTGKLGKELFWTNKKSAQTEKKSWKKLVKQIGENI